ncbi:protein SCO1/2 [Inhella inkyongensis]|uniref:Protein SCO1/2 n=1 Tax=Inhella inkyongensis TaxID=392593 RepID=A0A840S2I1_9BURK|nr:SCO family protein [Inhella inkyongensis]MBB5204515.1 protein SCO1/2 [Inhella inkyongensis]
MVRHIDRRTLLAASLALAGCDSQPKAAFQGIDLTGAAYARELKLSDPAGQPRSLADFKGKVVVLFFGYTQCPDVCPSTLGELQLVKQELGKDGERVQGLFVTVDPERDTPELLGQYIANFGPGMTALRGNPEQTQAAAKEFKVFYAKVPSKDGQSYTMDHTAASFLFDPQGQVRVYARYGQGPKALLHDLKLLLAGA